MARADVAADEAGPSGNPTDAAGHTRWRIRFCFIRSGCELSKDMAGTRGNGGKCYHTRYVSRHATRTNHCCERQPG